GTVFIGTSFGLVQAQDFGPLTVDGASAAVRATSVEGDVAVRTSSGAVVLSGVGGSVDVTNESGAIEVSGMTADGPEGCRRIALATSFAPIKVTLPEASGFDVNARTSLGKIRSGPDLPVGGGADSFVGPIGGGGCAVTLANRSGDITIVRGEASDRPRNSAAGTPRPAP
ncbi:MAG TPA: DUF4097 family beta strand repeat-containing protein, partial [Vicinamibacteria bacterium]|nr:DUF4097 family beta strand repeat-containing protein [Vicinamibacteria bacterium]